MRETLRFLPLHKKEKGPPTLTIRRKRNLARYELRRENRCHVRHSRKPNPRLINHSKKKKGKSFSCAPEERKREAKAASEKKSQSTCAKRKKAPMPPPRNQRRTRSNRGGEGLGNPDPS